MSIFGAMYTSVSGMAGQSNRLSVISDNIANSDTVGYKQASAQFQTLVAVQTGQLATSGNGSIAGGAYSSGGITTTVSYNVAEQGVLQATTNPTDLAIQGQGFFPVTNANGDHLLTRAGAFVPDANGYLVNSAGYRLMGVPVTSNAISAGSAGFSGLSAVQINTAPLAAQPSTKGAFTANLPASAAVVPAGNLPTTNSATSTATDQTTLTAYDNLGNAVTLDVYMANKGGNTWEMTAYNHADAASGGGFPYSSAALSTATLSFSSTTGAISSPTSFSIPIPNGNAVPLDISNMSQLGSTYTVTKANIDGNPPSAYKGVKVDQSGMLSAVYQDGVTIPKYQIQLAMVPSVNNLTLRTGNVYAANAQSGAVVVGPAGSGSLGEIASSELENSTVDIATELTDMIQTQRSYSANSQAFRVASDISQMIENLVK